MKQKPTLVWIIILIATVIAILAGALPENYTLPFRFTMSLSVVSALLNCAAIPFFIIGIKNFKQELQRAYIILCIGIGVFGLSQAQLPIINYYHLEAAWIDTGAIALPYLVGIAGIFWGIRSLSKLLGIKTIWQSTFVALLSIAMLSYAASFLPHVPVIIDETSYDISVAISILDSVFLLFSTMLVLKTRQKVGSAYVKAMHWLYIALATATFAGWSYAIGQLLTTTGNWYYDYSLPVVPFIASALVFVIAGYVFKAIDTVPPRAPEEPLIKELSPNQELEVVRYVANLVSLPDDITSILETIHKIASSITPGQTISPADQANLVKLYNKLEDYLLTRDSLRLFTKEELRERIIKHFHLSSDVTTTLWERPPYHTDSSDPIL
jgi:hypothetical protein